MKKPNLILHIGSPKTGTSFIQRTIINNESLLLEKDFLYPKCLRWHDGAHHKLAFSLREISYAGKNMSFSDALNSLDKEIEINKCSTVVVSSEILFFSRFSKEIKNNFLSLFSRFNDVEVVVFLREPISYLASLYKQMVKDPNDSLTELPSCFLKKRFKSLDYSGVINEYSSLGCKVKIFKYDKLVDISDLFFNDALGIFKYNKLNSFDINSSLDGPSLKLKFYYNQLLPDYELNKRLTNHIFKYQSVLGINVSLDVFSEGDKKIIEKEFIRVNDKEHLVEINKNEGKYKFQPVSLEMVSKFNVYLLENDPVLLEDIEQYIGGSL